MQWLKKAMLLVGMGFCAMGTISTEAQAKQVGTFEGFPIYDNNLLEGAAIEGSGDSSLTLKGNPFYPAVYDPRTIGAVSKVENQGDTNACWAFSTAAAIESNLIKKGYENAEIDISENHMAYFFYNRQNDPLGNTGNDKNCANTLTHWSQNGGTLKGTAIALTTGAGVVKATVSEDDATGAYVPTDLPATLGNNKDYVVANTYFYDYDVSTIKQAIMEYGAVASGICMNQLYWNADTCAYLSKGEKEDHAVAIVGWDDNFPRTSFAVWNQPRRNGAWIVKNSYGSSFGDGGYFYVSYEETSLNDISAFDMIRASECENNIYQYDGTANPLFMFTDEDELTCANVYTAKGSPEGYNEILEAVGTLIFSQNTKYSVQIYTGVTSTTDPTKGMAMFDKPQTGVFKNPGYNRIELQEPVTLENGEKYSVVIKLTSTNGGKVSIGIEKTHNDFISFPTAVDKKVGFLQSNGKWYDCGDAYDMARNTVCNLRIKAYTNNTMETTSYWLSDKNISISKGSSAKLGLDITPESVKREVTWTSSNKNVATVSSSGKVTAKGYGTAKIKAQFVSGEDTRTITCKVTVGPAKIKNFKVKASGKKVALTWSRNSAATGYVVYYSDEKDGEYEKLTTIKQNGTSKFAKKMKKGTYYVKMRPYLTKNGKKLYGSYTAAKRIKVR